LLAGLECALRLAGYGYPTTFFLRERIGGQEYCVPNDRFGFRFFPPAIARTPFALRMPAKKPANTYRIFLFGESAAQGDPDPTFGVSRYLQVLLRERFPGADFEVVCVAMTAINSHAILPIARECAGLDGDLWVIYMGNNEMVGPYGAGTIFGPKAPPLWLVRASLALKSTRTGQLLDQVMQKIRGKNSPQKTWSGLNMFKEQQLRWNDPGRLRALRNFNGNVDDILRASRKAHVPVVLATVATNLKDCPPFASLHKANLSDEQKADWEQQFSAGIAFQKAGDIRAALTAFSKAAETDAEFAELHFRMGQCELQCTNASRARAEFELAETYDALSFRADGAINQIIAGEAKRHSRDRLVLLDAALSLALDTPDRILGENLFYEHVHLNFEGNYLLARLFADQIKPLLPPGITGRAPPDWISQEVCDRLLAVSLWDRHRLWQANFSRVSEPPFTSQIDDAARAKRYMARLEQFRSQMNADAQEQTRNLYRDALRARPDDVDLHGNFAQVLGEFGDFAAAVKEQQRVCELLPHSAAAFHKTGLFLVRQNEMEAARDEFKHALALRPNYVPALNELGLILANQQKFAEADSSFREAIRLNQGYVETYISLGFMKQSAGKMAEALAQYEAAAQLQPEGPAAYFSKAVTLANQGQLADAVKLFQAAVFMNPSFWEARYLLGIEMARAEHLQEAEAQFAEVIRLRPDLAKAHMNLGVALAKQQKFDPALSEFRTALKLNPTNDLARKNIEQIEKVKGIR
jgi:tetratricopeptide (TPR) repeat protein